MVGGDLANRWLADSWRVEEQDVGEGFIYLHFHAYIPRRDGGDRVLRLGLKLTTPFQQSLHLPTVVGSIAYHFLCDSLLLGGPDWERRRDLIAGHPNIRQQALFLDKHYTQHCRTSRFRDVLQLIRATA